MKHWINVKQTLQAASWEIEDGSNKFQHIGLQISYGAGVRLDADVTTKQLRGIDTPLDIRTNAAVK